MSDINITPSEEMDWSNALDPKNWHSKAHNVVTGQPIDVEITGCRIREADMVVDADGNIEERPATLILTIERKY